MKKILLLLLVVVSFQAFGQNPTNYQYRTVRERLIAMMVDTALHLPRYNTTPSGLRVGSSQNSGAVAIDTINHTGFFYSGGKWRNFGSQSFETKLINGGIVTWDSLLIFGVSPAIYQINGAFYTSTETHLTLDPAHATLNRIDLIYLDSTGAHKLSGEESATPAEPNLPPNAIRLTAIQVDATVTSPSRLDTLIIYDENVEWTGAATSVTTNFAGTSNVCHFVKTTDLGAVTSASYIQYTTTTPIKISKYTVLKFNLTLKAAFAANTQLQLSWRRAGVLKSTTINIASGNYGYLRTAGGCQNIVIPISAWSFLSDSIDQIRFQFTGSNASGCYIDWIQLQEGITQNNPTGGQRFGVSGEDAIASQNRYFNGRDQYFFNFDSMGSYAVAARNTFFKSVSISGSTWLGYVPSTTGITIDPLSTSIPLNFNNIPYNSGAALVGLALDTLTNRVYRKTASSTTPGIDDVLAVGQNLADNRTINTTGSYRLSITGAQTGNSLGSLYLENTAGGFALNASSYNASPSVVARLLNQNSTNNDVEGVLQITREPAGGNGANGIGGMVEFRNSTTTQGVYSTMSITNQLISKWVDATNATRTSQMIVTGVDNTAIGDIVSFEGNKRTMLYGRLESQQGADVASLNGAIALGLDGNSFEITGTNAITLISNLNWANGSEVTLWFTSTASLTDGTANSGTDIGMELNANTNFTGSAGASITLQLIEIGGTQRWREKCRSVN